MCFTVNAFFWVFDSFFPVLIYGYLRSSLRGLIWSVFYLSIMLFDSIDELLFFTNLELA